MRQQFNPTASKCRQLEPAAAAAPREAPSGHQLQGLAAHLAHSQGLRTHPQCLTAPDPEGKLVTNNLVWAQGVQWPSGKGDIGRIRVYKPAPLLSGLLRHSPGWQQAPDPTAPSSSTVTPPWERKVTPEGLQPKVLPRPRKLRAGRDYADNRGDPSSSVLKHRHCRGPHQQ